MTCGKRTDTPSAAFVRLSEKSNGKDTTVGHWEIAGTPSTDHSREYIPFLALGAGVAPGNLGTLCGFDRIGRAVERLLGGGMERFAL